MFYSGIAMILAGSVLLASFTAPAHADETAGAKLLFQGHGSFRLTITDRHDADNTKVIYVDPYAGEGYDVPADMILVTHQHHDHNCLDLPAKKGNCRVIQNMDALVNGEYKKFDVPELGVQIEAVQAYNSKHNRDECVGYLVTVNNSNNNLVLYFSGDTSTTEQMSSLPTRKIDYAFLPMDGIYNMDIPEAAECAKIIRARHTVPVHMAPGKLFDRERAEQFAGLLDTDAALIIEAGQEVALN